MLFFQSCQTNEKIIFSSSRDGNSNIYMMHADGSNVIALTTDSTEEWAPTVIDKEKISFLRQSEDQIERFQLNVKTKKETKLPHPVNCMLDDKNIQYHPNGFQLYQCENDLYVVQGDGQNPINITKAIEGRSYKACWFPDGQRVAFTNNATGNAEIYSIRLDGTNLRNLSNNPAQDEAPAVSPNGQQLLFSSSRDGNNNQELYLLDLTTNELLNITQSAAWELIGRWSKDGEYIYFGSNKDGNWELYSYSIKKKTRVRLTNHEAFDGDPRAW